MGKLDTNVGLIDRIIRIILAIIFGVLFFAKIVTGFWGYVLLFLSFTFLVTAIIGHCCLYVPFKINTAKKAKEKKEETE